MTGMKKYWVCVSVVVGLILSFVLMVFLRGPAPGEAVGELVIFSGRKEPLIRPVIHLFEGRTGIHVTLKTGKSAALGQQILQELPNPSADIYIAKEAGSLEYLRLKDAFEAYRSRAVERVPERFRAQDGTWVGVSGRSRAVLYNEDLISREDVPKSLSELTDPAYRGRLVAVNAGNESWVAWVSALRLRLGDARVEAFLRALKENGVALISKSHTDIRKAVGRGEYPLGLINHYYYHLQRHEPDPELTRVGIVYLDQEEGGRGELVNVSGAAIVRGARHVDEARAFMDFLVQPATQKLFAEVNFEYPLVPGVEAHAEVLESIEGRGKTVLERLRVMDVRLDALGPAMEETHSMLDRVGWN